MSPLLAAQNGHGAMSDLSPLRAQERTCGSFYLKARSTSSILRRTRGQRLLAFDVVTINRLRSAALPESQKTAPVVMANSSAVRQSGGNDAGTKGRLRPLRKYPPRHN